MLQRNPYFQFFILSFILGSVYLFATIRKKQIDEFQMTASDVLILKELPTFQLKTYPQKQAFDRDQLAKLMTGKKGVFFHFWATWCAPCEVELPLFLDFAADTQMSRDYLFLLVSVLDKAEHIQKLMKKINKTIPGNVMILLDDKGDVSKSLGTLKLPETYLFNDRLIPQKKYIGPQEWSIDTFLN